MFIDPGDIKINEMRPLKGESREEFKKRLGKILTARPDLLPLALGNWHQDLFSLKGKLRDQKAALEDSRMASRATAAHAKTTEYLLEQLQTEKKRNLE